MSDQQDTPEPEEGKKADTPSAEDVAFQESTDWTGNDDLEKLRSENAELKEKILRSQAELENYRRRSQKESQEAMKYQSLPVIRDLLPGIDNLKRALDAAEQSGDTQNLIEGIKMVTRQFLDALKSHSAEEINPEGAAFDPNLHEALSQVPSAEHDPMTVLQVVESGYRIHDRVIRPAKVLVTCAPPAPASDSATEDTSTNED